MIKRSVGEHIFDTINVILLILIAIITLYPFWYTLVASISNPDAVAAGSVFLWPIGLRWLPILRYPKFLIFGTHMGIRFSFPSLVRQ